MNPAIVALAKEQGISANSFKKWRGRKGVPHRWRIPLLQAAAAKGIDLTAADLEWKDKVRPRKRRAA